MKKLIKITILYIIIFTMFSKISFVYADNKAPDGAYTDSGSEQKTNEIKERARENYLIQQHKEADSEDEAENMEWTDIFSNARKFIDRGRNGQSDFDIDNFKINIDTIYNILVTIGIIITVIVGGILGIKFMMASAEDKANIKEAMIPYVVGCIVIFGAFFIWKLAIMVVGDI